MFNFVSVSNHSIGEIVLDVVTSEEHESELVITENPIESGAQIADHAYLNPKVVTITGTMVDHNHQTPFGFLGNFPFLRGAMDFLNNLPLPANVANYTANALGKLAGVAGRFGAVTDALNQVRALAPWMPDFNLTDLLGGSGDSRVQKCYADLVQSQKSGESIEINTGVSLYKNMLIQKVAVSQDKLGSAVFTITAREIFIVDTAYVKTEGSANGSKGSATNGKVGKSKGPSGISKSGRAATQSASKTQAGSTQASPSRGSVMSGWGLNGGRRKK